MLLDLSCNGLKEQLRYAFDLLFNSFVPRHATGNSDLIYNIMILLNLFSIKLTPSASMA
jgi:hypothetical protein